MSEAGKKLLSDVVTFTKYSRYLPEHNRRETWVELIERNAAMNIEKYPHLEEQIREVYTEFVLTKKILPSMRSLQFGGRPVQLSNNRIFNCSFVHADSVEFFQELMFLLLGGSGVGYSVQLQHVASLPEVQVPGPTTRYIAQDSIVGWAECVRTLFEAYLLGKPNPRFDFQEIRPKGSLLKTTGGRAPGPAPLRKALDSCREILAKATGRKLTSVEVHDCACYIANAVLSGGIRRAAMIALFSPVDRDMLLSKDGAWWENNPQRGRANNSAVFLRQETTEQQFKDFWDIAKTTRSGEPGIVWLSDLNHGVNPCAEISLKSAQFCNLCEVDASSVVDQADLEARVKAAAFIGTLQAGYTDFHYLRPMWREVTEKEALLGVGMTGIASGVVMSLDLAAAASVAVSENKRVADIIGINHAARVTCVKPAGTTSLVLGCSSGIHSWHAPYYERRMRLNKNEPAYTYLKTVVPELLEDDQFSATDGVLVVPVKAPEGAVFRSESAADFLIRVKKVYTDWVLTGHNSGLDTHNVSATISIGEDEWDSVGVWLWDNKTFYGGLSWLPRSDHSFIQAPFTDCTQERYEELSQYLRAIDLSMIKELEDKTERADALACSGGNCEIK